MAFAHQATIFAPYLIVKKDRHFVVHEHLGDQREICVYMGYLVLAITQCR